jgi:hypothetical protein
MCPLYRRCVKSDTQLSHAGCNTTGCCLNSGNLCNCHPRTAAAVAVACGDCWERAIRDDERVVVLFGLPREIEPDPSYVDEVAVSHAVAGHRPRLTPLEEAKAVAILLRRGWSDTLPRSTPATPAHGRGGISSPPALLAAHLRAVTSGSSPARIDLEPRAPRLSAALRPRTPMISGRAV